MAATPGNSNLNNLPQTFRVGGSGFTAFHWNGYVIGFAQSIGVTSPRPVADPVAIQPLDQQYPMQIIVPAAITAGTLQLQMFEMYNTKVWDQIMAITDTVVDPGGRGVPATKNAAGYPQYDDLSQVFLRLSALQTPIQCTKIVYPPNAGVRGGPTTRKYADQYYGCVITDIRDDEVIQIGTMEIIKNLTVMFTYSRRIAETTSNL